MALNSSDFEFDPPTPTKARLNKLYGLESIRQLTENATELRRQSKRTAKQLTYAHGAPGSQIRQNLWVQRFESFRGQVLKQDLAVPFTGEDVLRFIDSMIGSLPIRLTLRL